MTEPIDEHVVARFAEWERDAAGTQALSDPSAGSADVDRLRACFEAQIQSRHLDLAQRWLQQQGEGFYTIGSAGHESNAAVALALRPTDPALLHYRSGGFYAARAHQVPGSTPMADVLRGVAAAASDPISGGRHKVFGNAALSVIPQTSTIASQLPRAFGLAFAIDRAQAIGIDSPWPRDAVVVASLGDASVNHSTAVGALNAIAYCTRRGLPVPLFLVCEDNGWGISTPTPAGWVEEALSRWPGVEYVSVDGVRPVDVLRRADALVGMVRGERRPAVLHLRTVRLMGHAGSDAELAYRSRAEIRRDYQRDPLLATAATLVGLGALTAQEARERYEQTRAEVMAAAASLVGVQRLADASEVMAPLAVRSGAASLPAARRTDSDLTDHDPAPGVTLAGAINGALTDLLTRWPQSVVFGQDVAVKGGVYGVTRGLRKRFGGLRVFDTLLDEQTVLGTALGAALAGLLPVPEIQYLAYLHNAEDQIRGEAASLAFFSNGQYRNGMVVRVAGLGYQKGFGGHFHNDNSLAVLRDIPGLVLAVPSHPADAPALLRTCAELAVADGTVCVFLEPIALYHQRDLFPGDGAWLAPYHPAAPDSEMFGKAGTRGTGGELLLVTFGNGVHLSMRAAARLEARGVSCTVLDLRWLLPLPSADLLDHARRFRHVLVVDETRASGGVSEGVLAALSDAGYDGNVQRVTSRDSFVPLGPAANLVLLSEDDIVTKAVSMARPATMK
jgi:2-oxoisovalerate dehydrogenase E1 component